MSTTSRRRRKRNTPLHRVQDIRGSNYTTSAVGRVNRLKETNGSLRIVRLHVNRLITYTPINCGNPREVDESDLELVDIENRRWIRHEIHSVLKFINKSHLRDMGRREGSKSG